MGLTRFSRRVGHRLLPARDREFVLGDLDELRNKWAREKGSSVATYRYLRALLGSIAARRTGSPPSSGGGGRHPRDRRFGGFWSSLSADLLSVLGAVLAAVGLYGVVAFAVAGRKREFGIRMALGAEGHDVIGLVARYALQIVVAGILLGLAGAWALSGVIESRLFGVAAVDAGSYAIAAGLLALVAAVACCAPALAAARVDPADTLRRD